MAAFVINDGALLEAENFDNGGQDVAYSDTESENRSNAYRLEDGVDIQETTDNKGGFNISWTADGEWLNYTVNAAAGRYEISARVASANANPGSILLQMNQGNGFTDLGSIDVQTTDTWQTFETLTLNDIKLPEGEFQLRLNIEGGNFNLNWIKFDLSPPATQTTAIKNGGWGADATWSHGVPDATKRAIIPQGRTVTLWGANRAANGVVIHGLLKIGEQENGNFSLATDWIHVNSNGVFQIGTKDNPYDQGRFTLTLTGDDPEADWAIPMANGMNMSVQDNNGFIMAGMSGSLQFFGQSKLTYTRLSATAPKNSNKIYVRNIIERNYDGITNEQSDGTLDWEVGDQIVIASSSYNYADEEIRTITAIRDLGNTNSEITLNSPLLYRHYGEIETYGEGNNAQRIDMRAEVAILNRNVKIQGLASQDTDVNFGDRVNYNAGVSEGVGGHIMVMNNAGPVNLDSVQLNLMGQSGRLGRYPIHWHIADDRTGDSLRGVSITNSNNRGVTVHGTHNLLIQDVVLHDIHGHGFFMEDAVETGNTYLANIAFGIHKVGRSEAVGDKLPDANDPFIVDTHDFVGQNPTRFLSSAAYWMTNPDNTWRGNISAGSEGTGFWFLFPSKPIGAAVGVAQYADVKPDKVNLREFNYNSSHSSPIGLNVDRGGDLESEVGATLLPNFNGNEYNPPVEPQFANFTGYKHTVALYHRGRIGNFVNNLFADNFNSTFITFTQRITNALYVGHSRGNSDLNQTVSAHTFYDGANTLDGTHFAGYDADNAYMFRVAAIAGRHTHFLMRNTSYEDDGSADNMQFATERGNDITNLKPLGKSAPSVLYDEDGTLTGHVGGKAGSTVIANHPYYYDNQDIKPQSWNARVSDNRYALLRLANFNGSDTTFRVTTPDGDAASDKPGTGQFSGSNALVKINGGDYTVNFPDGINTVSNGIDVQFFIATGPRDGSTIIKFTGIGNSLKVGNRTKVDNLNAVRNATQTSWAQVGNDIWVKFFTTDQAYFKTQFRPK